MNAPDGLSLSAPAVVGPYRLLGRLGTASLNLFRAEHVHLGTAVALHWHADPMIGAARAQFFEVVRRGAGCRHPGLAGVLDAGVTETGRPYVVLEPLSGRTLDDWIHECGPRPVDGACRFVHQIGDALAEAHGRQLVHGRLAPAFVSITAEGRALLFGFGAAYPAAVGYSAPELLRGCEPDERSDVYSLAAILLFAVTGRAPFAPHGTKPTPVIPEKLTDLLNRMTHPDPAQRPANASVALRALTPFLGGGEASVAKTRWHRLATGAETPRTPSVLLVDDEHHIRQIVKLSLAKQNLQIEEADNGADAVELLATRTFDLVLLDMDLPKLSGAEVLRRIRENPASPHLKVIVVSGQGDGDHLSGTIFAGADDFLPKPFSILQLRARVTSALRLKKAQDHSELLAQRLATSNAELELAYNARGGELTHARGALVLALAKLVEQRSSETGPHLLRLQRYSRILGDAAATLPAFASRLTPDVIQSIEQAAPLHDIGKVAVPDHILNKPGTLTADERAIMQTHAAAGADTLEFVTARFAFAAAFFSTAIEIARHHHEKWDGTGYPDQLAGESIPLSARLVAVGDVYDALRAKRSYKSGAAHDETVQKMLKHFPGHFDPRLLELFSQIHERFRGVFDEFGD